MTKCIAPVVFLITLCFATAPALNILGIFPTFTRSHFFVGEGIMKALAEAGHQVTMLSAFPQKKPAANYTDIAITGLIEFVEEKMKEMNFFKMRVMMLGPLTIIMLPNIMSEVGEIAMAHENLKPLFNREMEFDLVITEVFCTEAFIGFGQHFNAPVIAVSTTGSIVWLNELVGTPEPSSYVPNLWLSFTDHMTTLERLGNFLMSIWHDFVMYVYHTPLQRSMYNRYFPDARLSYDQALRNVSLAFINSHFSLATPKPYAPNMIDIGGVNIERTLKPLPKDIDDYMKSAKDGVVYFSMGSHLEISKLPAETIEAMASALGTLKQKVLWKVDKPEVVENLPSNVKLGTWFPQNEILAHPNLKLFISHGGLLSTTESVYHGVPILGLPVLGDQQLNIGKAVKMGWALKLNFDGLQAQTFENSIKEMINNPKYGKNVRGVSAVYRDQILTPKESVVYWTEYVARHNGAPHLHSRVVELSYVQRYNLDILFYLLSGFLVSIYLMFRVCLRICCKKNNAKKQKMKNN